MKICCNKNELLKGINIVSKAVSSKSNMEILGCILIEAENDQIKLTGNDTEIGIETIIFGTIELPGKIALEARMFSDIIRRLPDNEVILETEENGLTSIRCEKVQLSIMGRDGKDFTKVPSIPKNKSIRVSQFDLKEIIKQTIFSISTNENSRLMTGELMHISENTLTFTALDGHRIAMRKIELSDSYSAQEAIIPGKTLSEVSKLLSSEAEDMIDIFITDKYIVFEMENTLIVSRLLDGKFFNIDNFLSVKEESRVKINRQEFLRCLDRSQLFTKESDSRPIVLKIEEDHMDMMIKSSLGSMNDSIEIEKEGKNLIIGFNPKYMMDALRVVDEDEVELYMVSPTAPCIIKDETLNYAYLILPINVINSGF